MTNCDKEARKGHYHCEDHEAKLQHGFSEGFHDSVMEFVVRILSTWTTSTSPTISQRTLVTAVQQARTDAGLAFTGTYDGIALVLRTAVDRGALVSSEKGDTVFYALPPPRSSEAKGAQGPSPAEDTQDVGDPVGTNAALRERIKELEKHADALAKNWNEAANERDRLRTEVADLQSRLVRLIQERDDLQARAAHVEISAPYPTPSMAEDLVKALLPFPAQNVLHDMLYTGFYGRNMADLVREALQRAARDYVVGVKGKL